MTDTTVHVEIPTLLSLKIEDLHMFHTISFLLEIHFLSLENVPRLLLACGCGRKLGVECLVDHAY
jgi:hypothetical protein